MFPELLTGITKSLDSPIIELVEQSLGRLYRENAAIFRKIQAAALYNRRSLNGWDGPEASH